MGLDPFSTMVGIFVTIILVSAFLLVKRHIDEKDAKELAARDAAREEEFNERKLSKSNDRNLNVAKRIYNGLRKDFQPLEKELEIFIHESEGLGRRKIHIHKRDHGALNNWIPIVEVTVDYVSDERHAIMLFHGACGMTIWFSGDDWGASQAQEYLTKYVREYAEDMRTRLARTA